MHWLDLFSQFNITICHVAGKSNIVANALSHLSDLAVIVGSVEFGLLTWIREAWAAASGDLWEQLKKEGSTCERGFMFCDVLMCCTCSSNEISLVIPEDAGLPTDLLW